MKGVYNMEMNYRLIVRFTITQEVNEQYFAELESANSLGQYLDSAVENGAELGYIIQKRDPNGEILTIDESGDDTGKCKNLSWDA